jgi:AMMECR1 domain-containing protein
MSWEFGTHGVILNFSVGQRGYQATYLPEVPPEHGMTKLSAIEQLVKK